VRNGAGEGAFLVAEQLAFQKTLRQRGAVHGDKRALGSPAVPMKRMRDQFLTGSAFSLKEHGRVDGRRLGDESYEFRRRRAAANQIVMDAAGDHLCFPAVIQRIDLFLKNARRVPV